MFLRSFNDIKLTLSPIVYEKGCFGNYFYLSIGWGAGGEPLPVVLGGGGGGGGTANVHIS